jgi:hypothetical protein
MNSMNSYPSDPPNDGAFPGPMPRAPTPGQILINGGDDSAHHSAPETNQEERLPEMDAQGLVNLASEQLEAVIDDDGIAHSTDHSATEENSQDTDTEELMKHVNNQLEASMADYKMKVKHIFKELVAFQQEFSAVQQVWNPIQEAERKEAARLDELQVDLDQTMSEMPWLAAAMEGETTSE